jgi:succinate-acetate transporter protein
MTTTEPQSHPSPSHAAAVPVPAPATAPAEAVADRFASPVPVANPALVGVPTFMVGSIALALNLTNYVPQGIVGAPIAIIAVATGLGQLLATIFALKAGESAVASVFGIFTGFWLSYAALVLGLLHNWYGLGTGAGDTVKTFLLSWLILIVILTLVSLRLPLAFTILFVLVDLALLFVYLGYINASAAGVPSKGQLETGGYFAWGFIAVGAYLFLDAMTAATGGKNLPLGPAVLK